MSNDLECNTQKEQNSNRTLAVYTGIWLVSTALLAFGPKLIWSQLPVLNILAITINLISGAFMIRANIMHLKQLDELAQKIFLNSSTITLGVLMVVGVCYELVFFTNLVTAFEPRISHLYFVMGITFILCTYLGNRKYQ